MKFKFDFPLNEEATEKKELTRSERIREAFCKYSGMHPKMTITEKDIKDNWWNAYERVKLEYGSNDDELRSVLLK